MAIRDQALLLAYSRHKGTWYLPGGEVYAGETTTEALVREIREELNVELNLARLKLYDRIKERPAGRG